MINFGEIDAFAELIFKSLNKEQNKLLGQVAKGAKLCAEATGKLSLIYCPEETGALRASQKIEKTGPYHYRVTFGDNIPRPGRPQGAWYAVRVHEIEKFRHAFPTRWKYLEQAIQDLGNGHSDALEIIPSYAEIMEAVARGYDMNDLMSSFDVTVYTPSNDPIPD